MSKKFWAVHRETGEKWKPKSNSKQYLVMYDSGYLAVVTSCGYDGDFVTPLDHKLWRKVIKDDV